MPIATKIGKMVTCQEDLSLQSHMTFDHVVFRDKVTN